MPVKMLTFPDREEVWKPVKGYEGLYEVSNLGRVRTFHPKENNITLKPYIMPNGYSQVCLYSQKRRKKMYVHRLVAEAFVANVESKPQINHIDENKQNNCANNLEWVTCKENLTYGTRNERQKETYKKNGKHLKPVNCFSRNGELLYTFKSAKEAAEITGANHSHIIQCCKGKPRNKTSGGYVWKYQESEADKCLSK